MAERLPGDADPVVFGTRARLLQRDWRSPCPGDWCRAQHHVPEAVQLEDALAEADARLGRLAFTALTASTA